MHFKVIRNPKPLRQCSFMTRHIELQLCHAKTLLHCINLVHVIIIASIFFANVFHTSTKTKIMCIW